VNLLGVTEFSQGKSQHIRPNRERVSPENVQKLCKTLTYNIKADIFFLHGKEQKMKITNLPRRKTEPIASISSQWRSYLWKQAFYQLPRILAWRTLRVRQLLSHNTKIKKTFCWSSTGDSFDHSAAGTWRSCAGIIINSQNVRLRF
jgi:hypothetical protein